MFLGSFAIGTTSVLGTRVHISFFPVIFSRLKFNAICFNFSLSLPLTPSFWMYLLSFFGDRLRLTQTKSIPSFFVEHLVSNSSFNSYSTRIVSDTYSCRERFGFCFCAFLCVSFWHSFTLCVIVSVKSTHSFIDDARSFFIVLSVSPSTHTQTDSPRFRLPAFSLVPFLCYSLVCSFVRSFRRLCAWLMQFLFKFVDLSFRCFGFGNVLPCHVSLSILRAAMSEHVCARFFICTWHGFGYSNISVLFGCAVCTKQSSLYAFIFHFFRIHIAALSLFLPLLRVTPI